MVLQDHLASGGWATRARFGVHPADWRFGIRQLRRPGRIIFVGNYGLLQTFSVVDAPSGVVALSLARHSKSGDLTAYVDSVGGYLDGLMNGDTLHLSYGVAEHESEHARHWFMIVGRPGAELEPMDESQTAIPQPKPQEVKLLPKIFALRQNQPNPFTDKTSIHFDLPIETVVRLTVFDAQGRLVRKLVEGAWPAGFHAVDWDKRDENGHQVGSGVYMYRIEAGTFHDRKKMVLLP
jgi:hypothetical protein